MIIITGASRGIGKFLMESFIREGENVVGSYNTTSSGLPNMHKVDIRSNQDVNNFIKKLPLENVNITLINCAGANYSALAHKADVEKWGDLIDINVKGTFNLINAILPVMRANKFGRIINFSSVVAQMGIAGTSAYAASKSAFWGLARTIAIENAKHGITINNLNLGYFNIGMIQEVPGDYLDSIKSKIPSGELGEPFDIYNAVQFLRKVSYINGTSIDLNGGLI